MCNYIYFNQRNKYIILDDKSFWLSHILHKKNLKIFQFQDSRLSKQVILTFLYKVFFNFTQPLENVLKNCYGGLIAELIPGLLVPRKRIVSKRGNVNVGKSKVSKRFIQILKIIFVHRRIGKRILSLC